MEASGAQAKSLPVLVTVDEQTREAALEVIASGDRVEFSAAGVPVRVNVERSALLLALGVTPGELADA